MIMASPVRDRAVTDKHYTTPLHNDIASDLLVNRGLSGADTIAALHGIGKAITSIVAREGQLYLGLIGDIEVSMDSCQVTNHDIHICYISKGCRGMLINDRV